MLHNVTEPQGKGTQPYLTYANLLWLRASPCGRGFSGGRCQEVWTFSKLLDVHTWRGLLRDFCSHGDTRTHQETPGHTSRQVVASPSAVRFVDDEREKECVTWYLLTYRLLQTRPTCHLCQEQLDSYRRFVCYSFRLLRNCVVRKTVRKTGVRLHSLCPRVCIYPTGWSHCTVRERNRPLVPDGRFCLLVIKYDE